VPSFEFRKMRFNRHVATSLRLMPPSPVQIVLHLYN